MQNRICQTLVVGFMLWAQAFSEPISPWDVTRIRLASGVNMAPSGRRGFFTVSRPRALNAPKFEDGPAYSDLYVVDRGETPRLFLRGEQGGWQIRFSPDEKWLTFLARRGQDEHTSLYRISLTGGEAQRIYSWEEDIQDYCLAEDGRTFYFTARSPIPKARQSLVKMGFKAEVYEEDWRSARIFRDRLSGNPLEDFHQPKPTELKLDLPAQGHCSEPHLSPDGDHLVFLVAPNPGVDADLMYRKLVVLDLKTGRQLSLDNPGKLGPWSISPDGRYLAAISGEDIHDPDAGRLLVRPLDGSAPWKDLWPQMPARAQRFGWVSPTRLRALIYQDLSSEVWDLEVDRSRQKMTIPGDRLVTDASFSRDGQSGLFAAESSQHPALPYWVEGPQERVLLSLNGHLQGKSLARQEPFRYKARDGQSISGTLIRPLHEQAGQRYPLIVFVHGGPESAVLNGWLTYSSQPGQVAAARGYAVFYPNYRGSTDRGVAFSKMGQGDPAGKEFDDLVDGVDALVQSGLVDRSKVGITGGSYGGYATAWCCTYYSDRFAAGVMSVGISDKISKTGTTDIPDEEYLVHARKHPWEDWNFFLERSPIKHTGKSRTPLLILHGKDDPRVHPGQSLELYRYLKLQGQAPVRLVLYPGEGHGNRKAAARYDFNLRMLQWMDHYLKGPGGAPPGPELEYALPEGTSLRKD